VEALLTDDRLVGIQTIEVDLSCAKSVISGQPLR
jgi:hypothetical protein